MEESSNMKTNFSNPGRSICWIPVLGWKRYPPPEPQKHWQDLIWRGSYSSSLPTWLTSSTDSNRTSSVYFVLVCGLRYTFTTAGVDMTSTPGKVTCLAQRCQKFKNDSGSGDKIRKSRRRSTATSSTVEQQYRLSPTE